MIFVSRTRDVLLYRRDDKPGLREPGKWDLFGGSIEAGETPTAGLIREIAEELHIHLTVVHFFRETKFPDRAEFTYWAPLDTPAHQLTLHEGAELRWFSREEALRLNLAFGFESVLRDFFSEMFGRP